ncbi:restriction endonuclease subunit S [Clostridium perfringens]|uniref:restriction endonuclease subunit S n=1 Tax=Clostridium perfringens TaxID=1502 RepID=UPI0024BD3FDF|nr:restriction endonuclease subunit S [Clostridium perfringens]EIF6154531.1 restriction endonuclease subunit S [Clostridium perfringens]MDK0538484.1 restriction endonuclease subunit S [Clostridium perfringens]
MTYKRYDKYKYTNVKWLGKIPEHWGISKLKYLSDIGTGDKDTINKEENGMYPFFVRSQTVEKISTYTYDGEAVLTAGDGVGVGKVFHYINGKFDFHQRVYKISDFKKVKAKFFYYYIKENFIKETEVNNAKSTVDSIRLPMIQQFPVVIPSVDEQERIIKFLDKKTLEIDSLIEEKEKLIELLKEKREAIITEAVTKGVDKNVKMKESGVEWIAEIPSHWKKFRFKNICNINPNKSELTIDNERLVSFVPMENIKSGKIDLSIIKKLGEVYSGYSYFSDGDIIMAKVTPCFENGNIAIVEKMENKVGFGTTELHVLRVNEKVNNKYLYYLLQENGFKSKAISSMYGVGGLKRIPTEFIANFEIYIPDVKEQIEIIKYIEGKLNNIDIILKETNKSIEKIKEYKKSLISEVITGKIDVRGCKG